MKKIIFALIFALFVCASVACVSAAENTNMNTYNNDPSDLVDLKGQIDNLEAVTDEEFILDDLIQIHFENTNFMNNTATKDGGRIAPNHDADEIQDVELNNHPQNNQQDNSNVEIQFTNNTAKELGGVISSQNNDNSNWFITFVKNFISPSIGFPIGK